MKRIIATLIIIFALYTNAKSERKYAIYETKTGKQITIDELAKLTSPSDVVFFGEFHDDSIVHKLQEEYLKAFYQLNKNTAVSFEMFERDVQPWVDRYMKDEIREEEFLKNSRPWPDYYKFYKPLLEMAKSEEQPVIAANIPRKYAALYADAGWTGIKNLSQEEKAFVAKSIDVKPGKYMDNFFKTMGGDNIDKLPLNRQNTLYLYYGAQLIKDATMAESLINFLNEHKDKKIVHFNGDFHSNSYLGTVEQFTNMDRSYRVSVISPMYVETNEDTKFDPANKGEGDYLIVLQDMERAPMPEMMMSSHRSENYIMDHIIHVNLDPANSIVDGNDRIRFNNTVVYGANFKILSDLEITKLSSIDGDFDYKLKKDSGYTEVSITRKEKEITSVDIYFKGKVYHEPDVTTLNQRHSNTLGIVSDKPGEGIYLPGGSYYPETDNDLANFDVFVSVPDSMTIVTSGAIVSVSRDNGKKMFHYKTELNTDELTLVGGVYKFKTVVHDSKKFAIFTFDDNKSNDIYLDSSFAYYDHYTKLLGDYPYSSFSIVENFFATGFGMPEYTLLSNRLMALPWVLLSPGSLAHEFVHNWWGNSVYTDYEHGNWCEALTTFSANYYYNILTGNMDGALDWRKKALLSMESLPADRNYPVIKFKYQSNNDDAVIGYQKGAFIFYELTKFFGDEKFFDVMKQFASEYKGKVAEWYNMRILFQKLAKQDGLDIPVKQIFDQWLNRTNVPTLSLANVSMDGDSLRFSINQDTAFYMSVPVDFITSSGSNKQFFTIKNSTNNFAVKLPSGLKKIVLDPDYQSLRRLNKWEIPFSFELTLSDKPLLIMPEKGGKEYEVANEIAQMMKESNYGIDAVSCDDVDKFDWKKRSLIILGNEDNNSFFKKMKEHYPPQIKIDDNEINIKDKEYEMADKVLLLNCANPQNPNKFASVIYTGKLESTAPISRLFHYLSYSMVLLSSSKPGRPIDQMELFPENLDKSKMEYTNSK